MFGQQGVGDFPMPGSKLEEEGGGTMARKLLYME